MKIKRHYARRRVDDDELRKLWPSRMTDDALAKLMGHRAWVLRRRAAKLGLPLRRKLWEREK